MRIAILGTRGIPARYGGFETFAEQISTRLVERGHDVTVYCRKSFATPQDAVDPRIQRVILPTIHRKHFDTVFHTALSVLHVLSTKIDVALLCNVANSPFAWIPRVFGTPTVLNVDGLDRKRRKWGFLAQQYLSVCEKVALAAPTRIVTDAPQIERYFWRRYGKRTTMIAYGAQVPADCGNLDGFDLRPKEYVLYVSRLEPENNPELVLRAYRKVDTDWPLVVVGGNCYNPKYVTRLKALADKRVIFTGPVYGRKYWEILLNAGLYVSACEVGGFHPALMEAMAAENAVLYLDTPENRETAGDCGVVFPPDPSGLAAQMSRLLRDANLRSELARRAKTRADLAFSWEEVTTKYENLFLQLLTREGAASVAVRPSRNSEAQPAVSLRPAFAQMTSDPSEDHNPDLELPSAVTGANLTGRLDRPSSIPRSGTQRQS